MARILLGALPFILAPTLVDRHVPQDKRDSGYVPIINTPPVPVMSGPPEDGPTIKSTGYIPIVEIPTIDEFPGLHGTISFANPKPPRYVAMTLTRYSPALSEQPTEISVSSEDDAYLRSLTLSLLPTDGFRKKFLTLDSPVGTTQQMVHVYGWQYEPVNLDSKQSYSIVFVAIDRDTETGTWYRQYKIRSFRAGSW